MRRPDLIDVWIFRLHGADAEVLMLRRAAGDRILPGLWQGVSGLIEPEETITGAALREVQEETGLSAATMEAFFHLDFVAEFLWLESDALMSSAYFAVRVPPTWEPKLSDEHDELRWLPIEEAERLAVWPGYREGLLRIRENLLDPARASWFELPIDDNTDGP